MKAAAQGEEEGEGGAMFLLHSSIGMTNFA